MSGNQQIEAVRPTNKKVRGFSLIEVMIVVAIIGVLAAIALPSYRAYVVRGQLTDAATTLTTMRADMERYFQDFRTYQAVAGTASPPCLTPVTAGTFQVSCTGANTALTANTYTLAATGSGSTKDFVFTINQADQRRTEKAATGWTSNCARWVTKKGEPC